MNQVLLIPRNNLLLTEQALPTFLFYLPEPVDEPTVTFVLMNEDRETIYKAALLRNTTVGIAHLDLSALDNVPHIEGNQTHEWFLSIVCDEENQSMDLTVNGGLIRIDVVFSDVY